MQLYTLPAEETRVVRWHYEHCARPDIPGRLNQLRSLLSLLASLFHYLQSLLALSFGFDEDRVRHQVG
jgi:hypothetical protein